MDFGLLQKYSVGFFLLYKLFSLWINTQKYVSKYLWNMAIFKHNIALQWSGCITHVCIYKSCCVSVHLVVVAILHLKKKTIQWIDLKMECFSVWIYGTGLVGSGLSIWIPFSWFSSVWHFILKKFQWENIQNELQSLTNAHALFEVERYDL